MTYLRFGIRDLLWAMVVLGLAIGWWNERQRADGATRGKEFLLEAIDNSGYRAAGAHIGPWLMPKSDYPTLHN